MGGAAVVPPPVQPNQEQCIACGRVVVVPGEPDDQCVEPNPVPEKEGPAELGDDPPTRKDGLRHFCKKRPIDAGASPTPTEPVPLRGRRH